MTQETFVEVSFLIASELLQRIIVAQRKGQKEVDPGEAISQALLDYADGLKNVTISPETLRALASRANLPSIQSERDLLKAFSSLSGVGENAAVLELDPALTPYIHQLAKDRGVSLGEVLREYVHFAILQNWYADVRLETRSLLFDDAQWNSLCSLLGVTKVQDGEHLLRLIAQPQKQPALMEKA